RPKLRLPASAAGGLVVGCYVVWSLFASPAKDHLTTGFDRRYATDVAAVGRIVPAGALVGALNMSGPLRLYGRFQSFFWCHGDTVALLRWAIDAGRPVYTALDDVQLRCNPEAADLAAHFGYDINVLGTLSFGQSIHRIGPP
ncbi:MAG TPA: hypothetical protein VGF55_23400, partial [Gemmataceae bacterium]